MNVTTKLSLAEDATRISSISELAARPSDPADFQTYLRPQLGKMMHALRLDIEYDFAREDHLEYIGADGERVRVFDFLGGYGALLFGHNPPELKAVAHEVLHENRPFGAQGSLRSYAARLGRKLSQMFEDRFGEPFVTTLANSGAEAVEIAIKHSRLSNIKRKKQIVDSIDAVVQRLRNRDDVGDLPVAPETIRLMEGHFPGIKIRKFKELVQAVRLYNHQELAKPSLYCSLKNAYHGKTSGAVNLTANELYRAPFYTSMGPGVCFVDRADTLDFRRRLEEHAGEFYTLRLVTQSVPGRGATSCLQVEPVGYNNIAGLFIEPIQGEGGVNVVSDEFLRDARKLCDEYNVHLVMDEIQSGMGRTGRFLCSERSGVLADYYMLSKSLGGGLAKVSSTSIRRGVYEDEFSVLHSSTFAEDDYSSAIALRSLELLEERPDLMLSCARIGGEMKVALAGLQKKYPDVIVDVRGEGLLLAVEFAPQYDSESPGMRVLAESGLIGFVYAGYLLHEHHIRVAPLLSNNNVLRLEPPACIGEGAREDLYEGVERLCRILQHENFYELTRYLVGKEAPGAHEKVADYRGKHFVSPFEENVERTVAFIIHFVDVSNARAFDASCENYTEDEIAELLQRCYKYLKPFRMQPKICYSKLGKKVRLQPIGIPVTSQILQSHMERRDMKPLVDFVEQGIQMVADDGIELMGFGGFTSIIMQNCKAVRNEELSVTTGNSLTVGMGYEAILKAAEDKKIDLEKACFAAVGANGNIGIVYSELMVEKVPEVVLIGRPGREDALAAVAAQLYSAAFFEGALAPDRPDHCMGRRIRETRVVRELLEDPDILHADRVAIGKRLYTEINAEFLERGERPPITISTDPADVVHANLILGASSQAEPLIHPENLRPDQVIICDVALPQDTNPTVHQHRPDVVVIKGGVVRVHPAPAVVGQANAHTGARDFLVEGIPVPPDHMFACMCETVLLGLTGMTSDYSKGDVHKHRVREILEVARMHGYTLGALKTGRSF